jgi:hypothetical protein
MATDDQPRNGLRLTHAVRPFPVVLPALPDELLSSWFQRHANYYGVSGGRLLRHCGLDAVSLRSLDLTLTAYDQRRLAHALRSDQRVIRKMMQSCGRSRPDGLIAMDRPMQVCKRCRSRYQAEPETRGARLRSWMEGWRAKGIEAILYRSAGGADHENLYATLEEWRRYVADPTAWREQRLREIIATDPAAVGADAIAEAVDLLAHGDAATLLTRLTPTADWWTPLAGASPLSDNTDARAAWLRGRINDPAMVRACVALRPSDPQIFQAVLRRIPQLTTPLPPVLAKAWRLLARAAEERARDDGGAGWVVFHRIKNGDIDQSVREGVSEISSTASPDPTDPLKDLLQVTFEPRNHPTVQEILLNWPPGEAESLNPLQRFDRDRRLSALAWPDHRSRGARGSSKNASVTAGSADWSR